MAKRDMEKIRSTAFSLYMAGKEGREIASTVGVTPQTVSRWVNTYNWRTKRAAMNVTRPELVNKLLGQIDRLLDNAAQEENPDAIAGFADRLSKLAAIVERLDKRANVVDSVEVFMAFNDWLEVRSTLDKDLTVTLRQTINKYQDAFINEQMSIGL